MNRRDFIRAGGGLAMLAAVPGQLVDPEAAKPEKARRAPVPQLAPRFLDGRDWWFQRRFGLFVHWGLYAINGWHEQDQWRRRIPRAEYAKLAQQWNPVRFDPNAWLDLAESAGMQYICLTTKHHDGFCLFESKYTDYHSVNTPYGKDVVRLLAEACHRRHFPLCLYYSIADWHHPHYPNQGRHHELPAQPGDQPDLAKYTQYVKAQIRELCTNYGEIHGIWWDMNVDKLVDHSVSEIIRQLQPKAVINDRGYDGGDFGTPERDYSSEGEMLLSFEKRTEACQSVGAESWGYRVEEDYYADRHLLRSIDKYLARDANYLLNIGPKPDGTLPAPAAAILQRIGKWYHAVKESFQDVMPCSHLTSNRDVLLTRKGNTLYVHLWKDPMTESVKLKPLARLPRKATLLNTGQALECSVERVPSGHAEQRGWLRLRGLPVNELAFTVMVVKLEFENDSWTST
ncbi:MAG TPA: alpha-L-fucosidase [Candidatus Sulfotelmatobacter sp.]|nr:alpha-L-fucosidase [Candidatus Sulfotelmatobacter sp.]